MSYQMFSGLLKSEILHHWLSGKVTDSVNSNRKEIVVLFLDHVGISVALNSSCGITKLVFFSYY